MNLTRRAFIKANAAASAAAVAGISLPAVATNLIVDQDKTKINVGEGGVPILRHRMLGAGWDPGGSRRRNPGRSQGTG